MDFSRGLFWIAVATSVIMLVRLRWRALRDSRGWAIKCLLVLATALVSSFLLPQAAEWITGGLWAAIVVAPSILTQLTIYHLTRQRFRAARAFSVLLRILHPFDGWPAFADAIAALSAAQRGDFESANARLTELLARPGLPWRIYASARVQLCRNRGDWRGLLMQVAADDAEFRAIRLRALGETGALHELLAEAMRLRHDPDPGPPYAELFVLAFCGRIAAVSRLLEGAFAQLSAEIRRFWLATAELAADNVDVANREFERLAASAADRALAVHAAQRLRHGIPDPNAVLKEADWRAVAEIEARSRSRHGSRARYLRYFGASPVIAGLIAANLAAFALEIAMGGSENLDVLADLGAMWSSAVIEGGEWWRLVAATFLHFGILHMAFNMAALAILGPWVERTMGQWRTLVVYLLSGIGCTVGVLVLARTGLIEDEILVGASGAIFGLVGAQLVLRGQSWLRHRSAQAAQRLGNLAWGIALQVVFDFATPQVSFAGHACGLGAGVLLTLLLTPGRWRSGEC